MQDMIITLGIIGSVASIVSYLMEVAQIRSKLLHICYGVILVVITAYFVNGASTAESEKKMLSLQVAELRSIEYQAMNILSNVPRSNDGERRGFMFASLAMLEKFKDEQPDTYSMAKEFALSSGLLVNEQEDGMQRLYQGWALIDAVDAMHSLLKGLAGGSIPKE